MLIPVQIKIHDDRLRAFPGPGPVFSPFGVPQPKGAPIAASEGAAAVDLRAMGVYGRTFDGKPDLTKLYPINHRSVTVGHEVKYFDVGFRMHIKQHGFGAFILPRSSASAQSIILGNTVGLIDSDYTGPVIIALRSTSSELLGEHLEVNLGDRIAQMYFAPVVHAAWQEVDSFEDTARGQGGFGSTGRG